LFALVLTKEAKKNSIKIPPRYQFNLRQCFLQLQENPFYGKDIKKLSGELKGLYRYRIGNLRIVYHIQGKTVIIIAIGFRGNIYK